jgi:hypothetical protein
LTPRVCKFCKRDIEPEMGDTDTCDSCWYGMRLEPDAFEAQMSRTGVELADGGHGFTQIDDGSVVEFNRAPYRLASEPAPVNPTRAQIDAWRKTSRRGGGV